MVRTIKHRSYKMIEATVYTRKYSQRRFFNNIYPGNKIAGFAYKKFSRLKPNLHVPVIFFFKPFHFFCYFFTQQCNVCSFFAGFIGHFKATTKIKYMQFREFFCYAKQNFNALCKNFQIFYFAAGMYVQRMYMQVSTFYKR